ncbi:hypothetical protein BGX38DRAFT_816020 [Terfezia claveryi]|nr:hypothetical protein BGX38DRAFT_816020 [Terfezia claveryi]
MLPDKRKGLRTFMRHLLCLQLQLLKHTLILLSLFGIWKLLHYCYHSVIAITLPVIIPVIIPVTPSQPIRYGIARFECTGLVELAKPRYLHTAVEQNPQICNCAFSHGNKVDSTFQISIEIQTRKTFTISMQNQQP